MRLCGGLVGGWLWWWSVCGGSAREVDETRAELTAVGRKSKASDFPCWRAEVALTDQDRS